MKAEIRIRLDSGNTKIQKNEVALLVGAVKRQGKVIGIKVLGYKYKR